MALIQSPAMLGLGLHERIQHGDCTPLMFASESQLLSTLGAGKRFDLLLLVEEDFHRWNCLAAVARAMRIPTLLITDSLGWNSQLGPSQVFQPPELFDFLSFSATDLEIEIRIKSLLKKAQEHADIPDLIEVGGCVFFKSIQHVLPIDLEVAVEPRQFGVALAPFVGS